MQFVIELRVAKWFYGALCANYALRIANYELMKVYGIGTDITEISRIADMLARHGDSFKNLTFTELEIRYCEGHKNSNENFAARWSAKEAILKALGTGYADGIRWRDLEIRNLLSGKPIVAIGGRVLEIAREKKRCDFQITMSHCKTYATATAIIIQGNDVYSEIIE